MVEMHKGGGARSSFALRSQARTLIKIQIVLASRKQVLSAAALAALPLFNEALFG